MPVRAEVGAGDWDRDFAFPVDDDSCSIDRQRRELLQRRESQEIDEITEDLPKNREIMNIHPAVSRTITCKCSDSRRLPAAESNSREGRRDSCTSLQAAPVWKLEKIDENEKKKKKSARNNLLARLYVEGRDDTRRLVIAKRNEENVAEHNKGCCDHNPERGNCLIHY